MVSDSWEMSGANPPVAITARVVAALFFHAPDNAIHETGISIDDSHVHGTDRVLGYDLFRVCEQLHTGQFRRFLKQGLA